MLFPSYAPNSYHCLCSAWPIYPVPSLVVAILPVAFALTRRAAALRSLLCHRFARTRLALPLLFCPQRIFAFAFLPTANLCLCSGSPYRCFAPSCLALPLLSVQSRLCRRGSVLGWKILCLRRAAPCVVWLFNAVACRSKSHLIYAMPPQICA